MAQGDEADPDYDQRRVFETAARHKQRPRSPESWLSNVAL
jgi:hypothetical protein